MERFLKKSGWTSILTSIAFIIIGILLVINPDGIVKFISYALRSHIHIYRNYQNC
ncbi:MAG: hypothetical protein HFJ54_08450 [Clostridia bacterium]|nr:hypothetical protein [Clostridia bacterium]